MARIFISSTTDDLTEHRRATVGALRQLGHDPVVMEDMSASVSTPIEQSRADIDACDLYLGIIAWRYGFVPTEDNPGQYSFVELEYRHARERGVPTLVFLMSEEESWPRRFIDTGAQAESLERFRAQLLKELTIRFFTSPQDLAAKVVLDVTSALSRDAGRNVQIGTGGLGEPPPPPLPPGVDPFELAWRLVVDFPAEHALLQHMDLGQLAGTLEKWKSSREMADVEPARLYESALARLRDNQRDLAPNVLWLAWMRTTRPWWGTRPPGVPMTVSPASDHPHETNAQHDRDRDRDRDRNRDRDRDRDRARKRSRAK